MYTDEYTVVWKDNPETLFSVDILRLDKPANKQEWDALTEEEQESYDEGIFYYTHTEEEFNDLFNPDNHNDFYLLEED